VRLHAKRRFPHHCMLIYCSEKKERVGQAINLMGSKREKRKSEKKKFICRSWLFNHGTNLYHTNETQHLKPKPLTQPTMCNASYVSTVNKEKENKDYDA